MWLHQRLFQETVVYMDALNAVDFIFANATFRRAQTCNIITGSALRAFSLKIYDNFFFLNSTSISSNILLVIYIHVYFIKYIASNLYTCISS